MVEYNDKIDTIKIELKFNIMDNSIYLFLYRILPHRNSFSL